MKATRKTLLIIAVVGIIWLGACTDASSDPTSTLNMTGADTTQPDTTTTEAQTTTTGQAESESVTTTAPASTGSVDLELSVFDWTESNPPPSDAFVVVEGVESWTPDLEFGGDVHSFGAFVIGEPGTLLIYPDGHNGNEISATFVMTDEMISGSDQAQTHVEIYDTEVFVWGQAILDFEQAFSR